MEARQSVIRFRIHCGASTAKDLSIGAQAALICANRSTSRILVAVPYISVAELKITLKSYFILYIFLHRFNTFLIANILLHPQYKSNSAVQPAVYPTVYSAARE